MICAGFAPDILVALYTSAWIEMRSLKKCALSNLVALYTSAWIEIQFVQLTGVETSMSHSTRVRGLKSWHHSHDDRMQLVALYTSAWIEI